MKEKEGSEGPKFDQVPNSSALAIFDTVPPLVALEMERVTREFPGKKVDLMEACVREDCRPSRLVPSYLVAYLSQPAMTSMFVSDLQQLIGRTLSIRRVYMVTIYHRGCHTHRIARRRPATPNASSVTLQELIQFAYACGLSRARALVYPCRLHLPCSCGGIFTRFGILPPH